ncbi:MAG: bifunctional diaminohydroxyphosphoribosylaminopyrimidine deaminase/5-amino-6-(5-phosphoribosylamino)uracil reductase RibD [Pseudohongiellaceae bacterium]
MKTLALTQLKQDFVDWPVHMQRALDLAGTVLTAMANPRVGCVLVKDGRVVAEGWHAAAGRPHAEVHALEQAGADARGATAFVTLEPCSHQGRTGPCSEALIAAGIGRVVIAGLDPNPAVAGRGVAALEAAGVEAYCLSDYEQAARNLNPGYFKRREQGLPWLRLKLAMSLDGRTALANGVSKWITGAVARADVQRLRAASSAVLTGAGTILADDPALTVRPEELAFDDRELAHNAASLELPRLRVVLDSQLRTPGTARVYHDPGSALIFTTADAGTQACDYGGVRLIRTEADSARVDLRFVLESLAADHECNEVLVEAGATLSGAFLQAGLVDELVVYVAPKLLGSDARPLLELTGLTGLEQAPRFRIRDLKQLGEDVRLTLTPET